VCAQTKKKAPREDMFAARWTTAFVLIVNSNSVDAFLGLTGRSGTNFGDTKLCMSTSEAQADGRREFLTATVGAALFGMPTVSLADTLHRVDYPIPGKCGQAEVPENAAFFVKQFGGFKEGSCAVEGYEADEGTAKGTGEKDKERDYTIYGK
jgi:hypothetical protein